MSNPGSQAPTFPKLADFFSQKGYRPTMPQRDELETILAQLLNNEDSSEASRAAYANFVEGGSLEETYLAQDELAAYGIIIEEAEEGEGVYVFKANNNYDNFGIKYRLVEEGRATYLSITDGRGQEKTYQEDPRKFIEINDSESEGETAREVDPLYIYDKVTKRISFCEALLTAEALGHDEDFDSQSFPHVEFVLRQEYNVSEAELEIPDASFWDKEARDWQSFFIAYNALKTEETGLSSGEIFNILDKTFDLPEEELSGSLESELTDVLAAHDGGEEERAPSEAPSPQSFSRASDPALQAGRRGSL